MNIPFFSIIVVSFNAEKLIKKTINSVLQQEFTDYEIIVKDASSADNTINNIPEDARIHTYVTKDNGIYFGMNEAIGYASGKYLLFLNCGDFLADKHVLSRVYETAQNLNEQNTIIYGDYSRNGIKAKQPGKLTDFYLYRTPLCHQTVFFSRSVLQRYSGYDTHYKILADYDLTLKALRAGAEFIYCPCIISDYLGGGVSESAKGKAIKKEEYVKIQNNYFSKKQGFWYRFKIMLSFKGLRQKIVSDRSPLWLRKMYRNLVNIVNK